MNHVFLFPTHRKYRFAYLKVGLEDFLELQAVTEKSFLREMAALENGLLRLVGHCVRQMVTR